MRRITSFSLATAALTGCAWLAFDSAPPSPIAFPLGAERPAPEIISTRVLVEHGGYFDWCGRTNQIAFARQESPARSEIYLIDAKGGEERCLTCDHPDLAAPPQRLDPRSIGAGYRSAPAWHPSCEFLVFQLGNANFRGSPFERPPFGIHNDLWLLSADGGHAERLLELGNFEGVMSAFFSAEGDRLVWSERSSTGSVDYMPDRPGRKIEDPFQGWAIVTANFSKSPGEPARLAERREWLRGEPGVKRPSALIGQTLWFAHTRGFQRFVDELWTLDLTTQQRANISRSPRTWEEQALPSPWGSLLAYRSSLPYGWRMGPHRPNRMRLELWVEDANGARTQLTFKNQTGNNNLRALVYDAAWGPTGREIATYTARYEEGQEPRFPIEVIRLGRSY
jgi:hypothetical protein